MIDSSYPKSLTAMPEAAGRYFALMVAAVALLLGILLFAPAEVNGALNPVYVEGGFVESLTPIGYVFCIVLIFAQGGLAFIWRRALGIVIVLLAMTLRELDFHTRFTPMSVEKLKFYTSPLVPLHEKVIALLIVGFVVVTAITLLVRYGRAFLEGLRRFDPVSVATTVAVLDIGFSKSIDGIGNRLADIGYTLGQSAGLHFEAVEETSEFGIALFAIIAVLAYFGSARSIGRTDEARNL